MESWEELISEESAKGYYQALQSFLDSEYSSNEVFPPRDDVFNAFKYTALSEVKCVIIGQDPYHDVNQAHGLAFSVREGVKVPPSLMNIYKELNNDLGLSIPDNGYLVSWAKQGVLLLNTIMTVKAHEPMSHKGKGWEIFTDRVIEVLGELNQPIVFMLWGGPSRTKAKLLKKNPKHLILEAPHPSPLSVYRGFYGCSHFSKCNDFLKLQGVSEIDWQINSIGDSSDSNSVNNKQMVNLSLEDMGLFDN